MISIMEQNKHRKSIILSVVFWLCIWQILSMIIHQEILLVSPFEVLKRLFQLLETGDFYISICTSILRILTGFLTGLFAGLGFSILAYRHAWIENLLKPFVFTIKSIPVASFIILVLIWVKAVHLAAVISFLMVFPIIYENILTGLKATDQKLLEMAQVFRIPMSQQIQTIYISSILPYLESGCSLALGLAWKSGIAAEVIGLPDSSIGIHLYNAKVYLDTPDLFAWTVVIVVLSVLFEKVFMKLLHILMQHIEKEL